MHRRIDFAGSLADVPNFLEWFAVPVPRGFFSAIAKLRSPKTDKHYTDDVYGIERGNVFFNSRDAYLRPWSEAASKIDYAIQVLEAATGKASGVVLLAIYKRDPITQQLTEKHRVESTQRQLIDFLWSADLRDLETLK